MYIDTHCHLTDDRYKNIEEIISSFKLNKLSLAITVGYDYHSSIKGLEIAKKHKYVYCALGVHPHDCKTLNDKILDDFKKVANDEKVVAIGEIGLDYHYEGFNKDTQKSAFIKQLELAEELKLPVIIHSREATKDINDILQEKKHLLNCGGIMHCYSESAELVKFYLDLGFHISFAGPITYKNARKTLDAVKKVPLDRILSETDSPYLTPEPLRGELNYPHHVAFIAKKISEELKISENMLCGIIKQNVQKLFKNVKV